MSNHLKALVFAGNIKERGINIFQGDCATVQQYLYKCMRTRNAWGHPYGPTHSTYMEFSVRNFSDGWAGNFMKQMKSNIPEDYTFVYNATFDCNRRLDDYDDAMVVRGYVVDLRESCENHANTDGTEGQMTLKVKILLCNIMYIGSTSDLTLEITND